jgi:CRISPR-associated protein Csb2
LVSEGFPTLGATRLYSKPAPPKRPAATPAFDRMIVLRRDKGEACGLTSSLQVMAALRGALMKLGPQPIPEYLSGHAPESTPQNPAPATRPHVALAPLSNVAEPHANGDLLGAAILLPSTLSEEERAVCWEAVSGVAELRMPFGRWDVSVADAEERRATLRPETWTRACEVWSTVTPYVFDHYPKDPFGPEAEQIVRDGLLRAGVPGPLDLDLHYNPWHLGVPKASAFPAMPPRAGKPQRYHCHVRVRFAESVAGPIVAGAGRFYGYGLFRGHR